MSWWQSLERIEDESCTSFERLQELERDSSRTVACEWHVLEGDKIRTKSNGKRKKTSITINRSQEAAANNSNNVQEWRLFVFTRTWKKKIEF